MSIEPLDHPEQLSFPTLAPPSSADDAARLLRADPDRSNWLDVMLQIVPIRPSTELRKLQLVINARLQEDLTS
jgi:hypothetical protein